MTDKTAIQFVGSMGPAFSMCSYNLAFPDEFLFLFLSKLNSCVWVGGREGAPVERSEDNLGVSNWPGVSKKVVRGGSGGLPRKPAGVNLAWRVLTADVS